MANDEFSDAIMLLKHDHEIVEELFGKFTKASNTDVKWQIAQEICTELKIHTMIEEEIFYPATREEVEDDLYREAFVEHDGAKVLINDIIANGPEDEFFEAKVTVLSEEIEHHVKEEEMPGEGFFAQVRKSDVDLVELRDRMMARKQELAQQAKAEGGLPPAELSTLHPEAA